MFKRTPAQESKAASGCFFDIMKQKIGNQEPTIHFALPYSETKGQAAVDLYEATGGTAFDWQKTIIYDLLAQNAAGLWVHTRYGYSVPRQNGKGEILLIRELYGLAAGERILHTAHLTSTSHKAWERLCGILDKFEIPYHSIKAKGQELIELTDGGRVEFRTRTAKGGLGESYDLLIIDEAQEYQNEHESALKYVISASPNPQTIMCGTPPTPQSSGTVFKNYRIDVLQGNLEDAGWSEWSVNEMSDVLKRDLWYDTNPSLGLTLQERTLAAETGKDPAKIIDFNIQRLGLWIRHNLQSAISKNDWERILVDKLPKLKGMLCVGIKFNKNGESAALAIAVKTEEGKIFFEAVDCRPLRDGYDWIIEFLIKAGGSCKKIIIDGAGTQNLLDDELQENKIKRRLLPKVDQAIKANAAFERNLYDGILCRMEQPSLTYIATNCEKRPIGSKGGFGYQSMKEAADIALLDAAILAAWGTEEFPEPKKQRIGY